jgi:hypothetical protein
LSISPSGNDYTYTISDELNTFIENNNDVYEWRVRAYDGTDYSEWSDTYNFSIEEYVIMSWVNNNVDFGSELELLGQYDTDTGGDASPFHIRNEGNVNVTLANINLSSFWLQQPLGTEYAQYKSDYAPSNSAYNYSASTTTWTNLTENTNFDVVKNLDYQDTGNNIEIDINITVPGGEPPGARSSTLDFQWEIIDGYT